MESRNSILSNLGWKFMERMSSQLVTFGVSIVLARLLSPSDYGIISLILIFTRIGNVLVTAGFGNALIQKKDSDEDDFSSVFYFQILFSLALYVLLYVFAPAIADYMGEEYYILCSTLRVLGLVIPISAVNNVQQSYVAKHLIFKKFFLSTLVGTVLSAVIGITLAYLKLGVWALVAQYLTNNLVNTIVLWFTVKWRPKLLMSHRRLGNLISFGWKIMASELLNSVYSESRNLIVGKQYSSSDLAYYNKGQQFPSIIVTNINETIQSVLFPVVANVQNDRLTIKSVTRRTIRMSTFILAPLLFGFAAISDNFITFVLTEKWLESAVYLRISCFMFLFYPLGTTNLQVIKALGKGKLYMYLEVVKKVIGIAVLVATAKHGPISIAYGALVSIGIESILNYIPNYKLIDYRVKELCCDILPSVVMSTVMYYVVIQIGKIAVGIPALLCLQVLGGVITYMLLSAITKQEPLKYTVSLIAEKISCRLRKGK